MSRKDPIISIDVREAPGPVRRIMDILHALFGKVVSLSVVALLLETQTITNAAASAGTALTKTRTTVNFEDAGVDSVRLIVRAENSASGTVSVQLYNVTQSAIMAAATVTNAVEQTADSGWTVFKRNGGDEEVEIRVVGDGAFDPILYGAHMQMRTVQARA